MRASNELMRTLIDLINVHISIDLMCALIQLLCALIHLL
jgi:hypothetical protein